jgi:1,4-dihydroxy-2-naphthoyl-CoA synthase
MGTEFGYLDQGRFINLGARGAASMYFGSMYAMPASMVINGVTITKSNVQEFFNPQGVKVAETGLVRLAYSPDIGSMIIGGQELHLDNFCFN